MEVKPTDEIKTISLAAEFGVSEENCITQFDKEKNILSITFNKNMIEVPQVVSAIMNKTDVKDIKIQETELAEIVKSIYSNGVEEG